MWGLGSSVGRATFIIKKEVKGSSSFRCRSLNFRIAFTCLFSNLFEHLNELPLIFYSFPFAHESGSPPRFVQQKSMCQDRPIGFGKWLVIIIKGAGGGGGIS